MKITGLPRTVPRPATIPSLVRSARSVCVPAGVSSPGDGCHEFSFWSTSIGRQEPR